LRSLYGREPHACPLRANHGKARMGCRRCFRSADVGLPGSALLGVQKYFPADVPRFGAGYRDSCMSNTEYGNSNGNPKFCNAVECGDCKPTIKQDEQPCRTCDNQQRDNEAAQHPIHRAQIHTEFRREKPTMRESITKSDWLAAQGCTSQAWFSLLSGVN
jgi:hypothetical protein